MRGRGIALALLKRQALDAVAPSSFKSKYSPYSRPKPNVPDATQTGLFHSTPAMLYLHINH